MKLTAKQVDDVNDIGFEGLLIIAFQVAHFDVVTNI